MFKSLISVLVLATTVAGASLATSNSASAFPHFPIGGINHPIINFPVGGLGGGHGPVVPPGGFGGYPHPHPGFGFSVDIADGYDAGVSCGAAAAIVRGNGFHDVQPTSCYSFTGFKHGALFDIDVSRSGRIVNVSML